MRVLHVTRGEGDRRGAVSRYGQDVCGRGGHDVQHRESSPKQRLTVTLFTIHVALQENGQGGGWNRQDLAGADKRHLLVLEGEEKPSERPDSFLFALLLSNNAVCRFETS